MYRFGAFIFLLIMSSCESEDYYLSSQPSDPEMDVINDILPSLLPDRVPCELVPMQSESIENYEKRLAEYDREIDSIGKKLEIVRTLNPLSEEHLDVLKKYNNANFLEPILNSPNQTRILNSTHFSPIDGIKIIVVPEGQSNFGGLTDCFTLSHLSISRVGFNRDSTRAQFAFFSDDGSCLGGNSGLITAKLSFGKWVLVKE